MRYSRARLVGSFLVAILGSVAGCSGDDPTVPPTTGVLAVTTTTTGAEPDPDGYTVQVDGGTPQAIGANGSLQTPDVTPGAHTVQLSGIAPNCTVGDNPRNVTVVAGETATVEFAVTCGPSTGTVQVTTATSGSSPDGDGYSVSLDGADRGPLGASGSVTITGLTAGSHVVGLSGVAANCQVQETNPRTVAVVPGAGVSAAFTIICTPAPASAGTLRITTATTGADLDGNGYTLSVDSRSTQPIGINATNTLPNIAAGNHSVGLAGVAANCAVQGDNPRVVSLTAGAITNGSFAITCSATTGTIRVSVTSSGAPEDPNDFTVKLDGADPGQLVTPGTPVAFSNVVAGSHTVDLTDVASNCTVAEGPSRSVALSVGATAELSFAVSCTEATGSIMVTSTTSGPSPDSDGYTVALDGGTPVLMSDAAGHTFEAVADGTHEVELGGIASNCSVNGDNPLTVTVTASQQAAATFSVSCLPGYLVTHLGTLGGAFSLATDVNQSGQIVGSSHSSGGTSQEDPAIQHAFLWQNGTMTDLGTLGGDNSAAFGINATGQVVGRSELAPENPFDSPGTRAFLWIAGTMTDLGAFDPEGSSWANDISDAGQVVGWATGSSCCERAFLWQNGVMTDLGTLGGIASQALAINSQGQIVGWSYTADGEIHAFLWESGVMRDLGTLGGDYSGALGINDGGQVVGESTQPGGDLVSGDKNHAFLRQNGTLTDLGTLGGTQSRAEDLNSTSLVAGSSVTEDGNFHAFIWQSGRMRELPTRIYSEGRAVNDVGQVVGVSITEAGSQEATLWAPE